MTLALGRIDTIKKWRDLAELNKVVNAAPDDALVSDAFIVKVLDDTPHPQFNDRWSGKVSSLPFGMTVALKLKGNTRYLYKLTDGTYRVV